VLRYVPIAALHDGNQYLIEKYAVAMFTPASASHLIPQNGRSPKAVGFGVSKAYEGFEALPNVILELNGIIRAKDSPEGIIPGEKQVNDAFTSISFRAALRRHWPVVHIASHFHFEPGNERQSFLLLGDGARMSVAEFKRMPNIFENVNLLTLSACDTGLGDAVSDGTEVEAFGVLAQRQGAAAVVPTLWSVDDASTSALMREFYRLQAVNPTAPKIDALRQAQLAMLHLQLKFRGAASAERGVVLPDTTEENAAPKIKVSYSHPFFWAPFFMIGDWL